ncbi:HAUS augmin-like complex subunit 5 [Merluccius polli]|uniref:HAUS augmin-like complex subunit 5 n=1 Tax=Merluccius polli TaxID=89951 RepID=A0AA47N9D2_MERPO|nr:HAUS augmin-like complex subunit 5 [Merluccius polli]
MADRTLVHELKRWATEEFNLPPQSLPSDGYFKTLCVGSGASIWKYVVQHVYQQRNVRIMRGNLQWYKALQDKEVNQVEGQSETAKRRELQEQIEQLRADLGHLDYQISATEEELATEERSIGRTWAQVEEADRRELLLQAFRRRCTGNRQTLTQDILKISKHSQTLEQLARKADVEVLFGNESSTTAADQHGSNATAEAQVLRDVRVLCDQRVDFFQSLQESELKTVHSAASHMTCEQRTTVFQYWLSNVEELLRAYPSNQVLLALQFLASRQQRELEEKMASLDVTQDVSALRFRYESNHLLDISREEEAELPPVKHLLQAAWEDVGNSYMELKQTRLRIQKLQSQLQVHKGEAEQEVSLLGDEHHGHCPALSVFELELQCEMQTAATDYIRDQCLHLDQQARSRQEALRNLHNQWQNILDFRRLVDARQEQIRGLIKGNSTTKTELIRLHRELGKFVQDELLPQFGEVITAASKLRNCISQEARQFGGISLSALDRRTVEEGERIPASCLSIYRLQSPSFHRLCQSLSFALYRAPEELCSQARSQDFELRFLRQLLHLHNTSLHKVQKQVELLHAPDQKALLAKVTEEDQKLLETLVPRSRELAHRCTQGLSYCNQVKLDISHWWDQPARNVLPQLQKGGLTLQQWLQRWRLAAKTT